MMITRLYEKYTVIACSKAGDFEPVRLQGWLYFPIV